MKTCPFLNKKCIEHKCMLYKEFYGTTKPDEKPAVHFVCSLVLMPDLLVENSRQQAITGASIQSFRNEMVRNNVQFLSFLSGQKQLIEEQD
jgi:hypothetical protein